MRIILLSLLTLTLNLYSTLSNSFAEIIEKALPSIVFVAKETNSFDQAYQNQASGYQEYFRPLYEYFWPASYSHGSGFFMNSEGHVMTCAHCVKGSTKTLVVVQIQGMSKVYPATIVGIDEVTDIAVLRLEKTEGHQFPYLPFGNSDHVRLGEPVIAIGNPVHEALHSTVTMGIVSGKDRDIGFSLIEGQIQVDAPINGGNSGCPLMNASGEVIGIINSCIDGYQGINFAIPSNFALAIGHQLIDKGKISRSFLGVKLEPEFNSAFDQYYFHQNQGALLTHVVSRSPAEEAGLLTGDRLVSINGVSIASPKAFVNRLWTLPPSQKIKVGIDRQGYLFSVEVKLSSRENWLYHFDSF